MDRQYTRVDSIRKILDKDIKEISDEEIKRCAYVHLYGVGQAASFITMKRGFSRKYAELAQIAGMLHDYARYIYNEENNHAEKSARCAKKILKSTEEFSDSEIELICDAICNHSDKDEKDLYNISKKIIEDSRNLV